MKHFKIPKEHWKRFPSSSIQFILEEAKEYLDYTLKESDKITNRAYSLTILLATILSAIVGYTFSKLSVASDSNLLAMNLYFSIVITGYLIFLIKLIFPRDLMQKGRLPSKLANEKLLLSDKLSDEEILQRFKIREIENIQDKINFNLSKNKSRRVRLKISLYSIAILLPTYLGIAFYYVS